MRFFCSICILAYLQLQFRKVCVLDFREELCKQVGICIEGEVQEGGRRWAAEREIG